jgi:hypothetical protein
MSFIQSSPISSWARQSIQRAIMTPQDVRPLHSMVHMLSISAQVPIRKLDMQELAGFSGSRGKQLSSINSYYPKQPGSCRGQLAGYTSSGVPASSFQRKLSTETPIGVVGNGITVCGDQQASLNAPMQDEKIVSRFCCWFMRPHVTCIKYLFCHIQQYA